MITRYSRAFLRCLPALALALGLCLLAGAAQAQTPTPFVDYADLGGDAKTEIGAAVGDVAPIALSIMAGMLGLGLLFRWIKRSSKVS